MADMTQEELEKLEQAIDINIKTLTNYLIKDPSRVKGVEKMRKELFGQLINEHYTDQILEANSNEELEQSKMNQAKSAYEQAINEIKGAKAFAINNIKFDPAYSDDIARNAAISKVTKQYDDMEKALNTGKENLDKYQERLVKAKNVANDYDLNKYMKHLDDELKANDELAGETTKRALESENEYNSVANSAGYKEFEKTDKTVKLFEDYEKVREEYNKAVAASDHAKAAAKQKQLEGLKNQIKNNGIIALDSKFNASGSDITLEAALNDTAMSIKSFISGTIKDKNGNAIDNLNATLDNKATALLGRISALEGKNRELKAGVAGKATISAKELKDLMENAKKDYTQLRTEAMNYRNMAVAMQNTKNSYDKQQQFANDKATMSEKKLWEQEAKANTAYQAQLKEQTNKYSKRYDYWRNSKGNGRWKSFWKSIPVIGTNITKNAYKKDQLKLMEASYNEPMAKIQNNFRQSIIEEAKKGKDVETNKETIYRDAIVKTDRDDGSR